MSNRSYSRNFVACCPKCLNKVTLTETVDVSTTFETEDDTNLAKISAMELYGVEHSRYACRECGIDMNNCDTLLFDLFSELHSLPYNVITSAANGTLGGCIGSTTADMLNTPHEKSYAYPSILFCNSDQDVINGLIATISDTVGSDTTYSNIRMQLNPIGSMNTDEEGNPVESLSHFQIMIFINDNRFTTDVEEYNASVEVFVAFANLIKDAVAAFGVQERERAAIKAAEEEAARIEAEQNAQEETEAAESTEVEGEEVAEETEADVTEEVVEETLPEPEVDITEDETETEVDVTEDVEETLPEPEVDITEGETETEADVTEEVVEEETVIDETESE